MPLDVLICFGLPIVWIFCSALAHVLLMRRGYPRSESWLPGCLLGPLGVIAALLMPPASPRSLRWLTRSAVILVLVVIDGGLLFLLTGAYGWGGLPWFGLFLMAEVAAILLLRRPYRLPRQALEAGGQPPARSTGPTEDSLWIQSADYSSQTYPLTDAREAIRLFRDHDWAKEAALLRKLEAAGEDFCPPGLGLNRADGRFLHICPGGGGQIAVYFKPQGTPMTGTWTYRDLRESDAEAAIEAFFSPVDDWFRANTSYGS
jgi:hypothetical protein